MGKTSGLSGSSVDSNSDINDISNTAEQVVEVSIGHLEGHVADEEGLGGRILRSALLLRTSASLDIFGSESGVLNHNATAFVELLMHGIDRCSCSFGVLIVNIAKPLQCKHAVRHNNICNLPFAQPTSVSHNSDFLDRAESPEFCLQIVLGDIEEQVADVDGRLGVIRRCSSSSRSRSFGGSRGCTGSSSFCN